MLMTEKIAAFFDFDQTLVEVESAKMGFKWLKENRMLPLGYALKILITNTLYRRHIIPEERMVKILLTFYRGKNLADFEKSADAFYRKYLEPHLAPRILSRLDYHKNQGHVLVLISGSVRYWLKPAANNLGFDHLLSTDLEEGEDGLLTGRPKGLICVGENKRVLSLELARKVGIDIKESYAYGNHQADIPLLELVGKPYVVEPTEPLKIVASQRSWPILSFR